MGNKLIITIETKSDDTVGFTYAFEPKLNIEKPGKDDILLANCLERTMKLLKDE